MSEVSEISGNEVILSLEEFQNMVNQIKELQMANEALNEQIREYNDYAEQINESNER